MNLYEALKSGTSLEDLKTAFEKELTEASARIKQETKEEKEREEALTTARSRLTEAIGAYAQYYNESLDSENKVNYFIEVFENEINRYFKNPYIKSKDKSNEANKTSSRYSDKTLSDIILDFLEV